METSRAGEEPVGTACLKAKKAGRLSFVLWHDMQESAVGSNEHEATAER
jgi:hypothetical protein